MFCAILKKGERDFLNLDMLRHDSDKLNLGQMGEGKSTNVVQKAIN